MEYGSIEREIHVEASPEVVFEVVTRPEHLKEWWPDDARGEPVPGAPGELVFRDPETGTSQIAEFTVVEVDAPRRFSFRWCFTGEARTGASLLVTFDLTPAGGGTTVRMTETGFREVNRELAAMEEQYLDHVHGWDRFIPRLGEYVGRLASTR